MLTCSNPPVCENWCFFKHVMVQIERNMRHQSRKATFYIVLFAREGVAASGLPLRSVGDSPAPMYRLEEKSRTEAAASFWVLSNENVKGAPLEELFCYSFLACHQKFPGFLIPETPDWEIQSGKSTASPWPRRQLICTHHPKCHMCACSPASAPTCREGWLLAERLWEPPLYHPTISS